MATELTDDLAARLDRVPGLAGVPRTISELPGGLTNHNYKVTTPDGAYVARVWSGGGDFLAINRDYEHHNSVAAAQAGVGAPVVAYRPEDNLLVLEFIQGRYAAVTAELGFKVPAGYDALMPQVESARRALAVRAGPTVPCNNDLLAANFIDDGERLWLIDYEYSGNNDPCFELGNIWGESGLSGDALAGLVTGYYGRPLRNKIARAQLLGIIGKYGWTLWGAIQAATSPIEFDFWSWAMARYEGAAAGLTSRDFGRLLDDVQRDD